MTAKLTAKQIEALTLVADNKVIAILRGEAGYLTINGNTEHALRNKGLITKSAPVATGTRKIGSEILTYDICVWEITAEGLAALGREVEVTEVAAAETAAELVEVEATTAEDAAYVIEVRYTEDGEWTELAAYTDRAEALREMDWVLERAIGRQVYRLRALDGVQAAEAETVRTERRAVRRKAVAAPRRASRSQYPAVRSRLRLG